MIYNTNISLLILISLSAMVSNEGEPFQFFLKIFDMLDPQWIYEEYNEVETRIKCASLCFRDEENCYYFGYKNETCYLLKSNVDENACSQEDCSDPGMKVYKWDRVIQVPTAEPSTEEPFNCDPPKGAEARVNCELDSFLLRAMGSRSPFFGDVLGATCTDMKEQVYKDEAEVLTFFSLDGGINIQSQCPDEHQVIVEFKLCVKNTTIPAITLHCHYLVEPNNMDGDLFNVTSDPYNQLVDCDQAGAVQKIFITRSDKPGRKVIFTCVKMKVKEGPVPGI